MIATFLQEAVGVHRAGDFDRAKAMYEQILQADPRQADALHMLGLIAQQSGDFAAAQRSIEAAIGLQPDVPRTHYNLAIVRGLQGDIVGAIAAYETAVTLAPLFAEAQSNLGNLYVQFGRYDDAIRAYTAAIRARPEFAAVYSNLATVCIHLERFEEAISALEVALRLAPAIPEVHANLGQAYRRSFRFRDAVAATQRAIRLRPDYRDAYVNLALAAYALADFDLALDANLHALALAPSVEVHEQLSCVYHALGRYDEAIAHCDAVLATRPDSAEAHVNRAVSLLVRADFARGWEEYTWMWRLPAKRASYPYLDRTTLWNGEDFRGRRLLVTRDQGFGDAIQMVRYLPLVKQRGGSVHLEVAAPLVALFDGLPGIDAVCVHRDVAVVDPSVDLHVPLSGLPRALQTELTSIPATVPYLKAPAARIERWRNRLDGRTSLRVGIVWSGNPDHENDRNRSSRLEDFAPLGDVPGVTWYGFAKGRDEQRRACGLLTLDPLGSEIGDFGDTAAIVSQLDLVIAVDTAIVHVAGALGIRVWTLLPFVPDWRWMLERSDSPWYPTMRLFRQPRAGDWATVVAEVGRELHALASRSMRGSQIT